NLNLGSDGVADSVTVFGTEGNDAVEIFGSRAANVAGLTAGVTVLNADAALDSLVVNVVGGDDVVNASGLGAVLKLTEDGGAGDDSLIGSRGADVLLGGDGDDTL